VFLLVFNALPGLGDASFKWKVTPLICLSLFACQGSKQIQKLMLLTTTVSTKQTSIQQMRRALVCRLFSFGMTVFANVLA
jgi:hypothetical protein